VLDSVTLWERRLMALMGLDVTATNFKILREYSTAAMNH
jgi:hypothetical protein